MIQMTSTKRLIYDRKVYYNERTRVKQVTVPLPVLDSLGIQTDSILEIELTTEKGKVIAILRKKEKD